MTHVNYGPVVAAVREADLEIDHLKTINAQLLKALKHIHLIVSPHVVGKDECDKPDAAIKAGMEE